MEHIKIFNSVAEKDNFIDADSFKYDIVGLVKNVEGVVYNPPDEIIHSYVVSNIRYNTTVPFNSTANTVTWDFTVDKTTRSGKHVNYNDTDSQDVTYPVNTSSNDVTIDGDIVKYGVNIPYDFTQETGVDKYFSFTALENGTFTFNGYSTNTSIQYSVNNGASWVTLSSGVASPTVTSGNRILWKGTLTSYSSYGVGTFSSTGKFDAQGNIMSLLYGDNFEGQTTVSEGGFATLFKNNGNIVNSNGIILPITTAPNYCCFEMFRNCTSLETAMELKATTIGNNAYQYMFVNTKISNLPSLPATTLGQSCYAHMFGNCENITNVPVDYLPATALTYWCYGGMFSGCINLINVPNLPATSLANECYESMFNDCSSLKTVPVNLLQATTVMQQSYKSMFRGCTSLETAPNLLSNNIGYRSYHGMFDGCISLVNVQSILPATRLYEQCYLGMFKGCSSLITAPELPATTLASNCYNEMFNGCSSLNYIKAMFTTTPSTNYTDRWVVGVSSTGTFVKNSSASWSVTGGNGIPEGWTVETASS